MKLLALDTSSIACSVALMVDGGTLIERHEEQPREHTRLLVPMIREVLEEAGIEPAGLDAIVPGNGPGSFIGMRIAASVAQGLAHAAGLCVVPVSSMAAIAAEVFEQHAAEQVVVAQDAHMGQVYLGIFRRGASGIPVPVMPERLAGQGAITELDMTTAALRIAAGFGWQRYPALREENRERFATFLDVHYPRARYLLAAGAAGLEAGQAIEPQALEPAYLREQVARPADEGP